MSENPEERTQTTPPSAAEPAASGAAGGSAAEAEPPSGPYKNLWVPLLVVPAGIVMVLLCVFLFFGAIGGRDTSLAENLQRVVNGGANEREQALLSLVVQVQENQIALDAGREPPWKAEEGFVETLRASYGKVDETDYEIRMTLASLQAQLGDDEGVTHLLDVLQLGPEEDPDGKLRFNALAQLGALGDERARADLLRYLGDTDPGLRSIAAVSLKKFPGEDTLAGLRGGLGDLDFVVRANAALSLASLGDASGAGLLVDMLDPALYAGEREAHERRFQRPDLVIESRRQAVEALGLLRRAEDQARLEALAEDDPDLAVREEAMRALASWNG